MGLRVGEAGRRGAGREMGGQGGSCGEWDRGRNARGGRAEMRGHLSYGNEARNFTTFRTSRDMTQQMLT